MCIVHIIYIESVLGYRFFKNFFNKKYLLFHFVTQAVLIILFISNKKEERGGGKLV